MQPLHPKLDRLRDHAPAGEAPAPPPGRHRRAHRPGLDEGAGPSVFRKLDVETAAQTLHELEPELQVELIEELPTEQASDILEQMPADEAADILGDLEGEEARDLVKRMEKDAAEDVTELLVHDEDTAGGMMGTEYIAFPAGTTVAEAFARLRSWRGRPSSSRTSSSSDRTRSSSASLSLRDLLAADDDAPLEQVMRRPGPERHRGAAGEGRHRADGEVRPARAARDGPRRRSRRDDRHRRRRRVPLPAGARRAGGSGDRAGTARGASREGLPAVRGEGRRSSSRSSGPASSRRTSTTTPAASPPTRWRARTSATRSSGCSSRSPSRSSSSRRCPRGSGRSPGRASADLIRENFGLRITFYLLLALLVTDIGNTVAEFAGWAAAMEVFGVPRSSPSPSARSSSGGWS